MLSRNIGKPPVPGKPNAFGNMFYSLGVCQSKLKEIFVADYCGGGGASDRGGVIFSDFICKYAVFCCSDNQLLLGHSGDFCQFFAM